MKGEPMRIGVVDTGGGLRGIYGAGLFDTWLKNGVSFDVAIGVSAGGANVASFLGTQIGRNYTFYMEYSQRPQYMSLRNFVRTRNYLDLDYIYGTLSVTGGENPLNYKGIVANPADMAVVATCEDTGRPRYFSKEDLSQDNYDILKATAAIPFVCKPYQIGSQAYYDGALSDPVPVDKAFEMGCDKVVLILTRPRDTVRVPGWDPFFARRIRRDHPQAALRLEHRAETFNLAMRKVRQYEKDGKVLILAPKSVYGAKTLSKDREPLRKLYENGVADAPQVEGFM